MKKLQMSNSSYKMSREGINNWKSKTQICCQKSRKTSSTSMNSNRQLKHWEKVFKSNKQIRQCFMKIYQRLREIINKIFKIGRKSNSISNNLSNMWKIM